MASLEVGIVGLPNSGKTSLFNALTESHAEITSYAAVQASANVGIAAVPDERIAALAQAVSAREQVPATVQFSDVSGLVRGSGTRDGGLGGEYLGHLRATHALAHVVRVFDDEAVSHPDGRIDPRRIQSFVQRAEALGFHSAWVVEHTFGTMPALAPIELLTYAAAVTERLRLGAAVLLTALVASGIHPTPAAAQFLPHFRVRRIPETPQIARRLHRPAIRRQQREPHRLFARADGRRVGQAEQLLQLH